MRYVRRPEKVSAVQWRGDNFDAIQQMFPQDRFDIHSDGFLVFEQRPIAVPVNEWVIKTDQGEAQLMGDRRFREEFMPVERVACLADQDWE